MNESVCACRIASLTRMFGGHVEARTGLHDHRKHAKVLQQRGRPCVHCGRGRYGKRAGAVPAGKPDGACSSCGAEVFLTSMVPRIGRGGDGAWDD